MSSARVANRLSKKCAPSLQRVRKSHGPEFEEAFTPPKAKRKPQDDDEEEEDGDEDDDEGEEEGEEDEREADAEVASTVGSDMADARCDFCLKTSASNNNGVPEELLICKDCQAKAHPSCMNYSEELARRARTSPWQCIECKTCYICADSRDPDSMLFCDACDKGYHMDCHSPPIKEKPTQESKWVCYKCKNELGLTEEDMEVEDATNASTDNYNSEDVFLPVRQTSRDTPYSSEVITENNRIVLRIGSSTKMNGNVVTPVPKLATTMKSEVPDASDWTIADVVSFFSEMGFSQQAEVFREQEIDGKSLLLMKRSDVLQGLGLKLGPALKIYAHVQRLQTREHIIF